MTAILLAAYVDSMYTCVASAKTPGAKSDGSRCGGDATAANSIAGSCCIAIARGEQLVGSFRPQGAWRKRKRSAGADALLLDELLCIYVCAIYPYPYGGTCKSRIHLEINVLNFY